MKIRQSIVSTGPLISALNGYEKPLADLFIVYGISKDSLKGK